ncbi:hypothetical protein [Nioella aestuarii]|uniref:hypothetical protein n=1 Tax=Nioella aestuarii TaxID=1662864 RepID=UPI003D7F1DCA
MIRQTILLIAILLALPLAARAQEDSLIADYRAEITELRDVASSSSALGIVRGQLSRAFIENDIVFSRRYLDNWSQLLQDRWAQHDTFFATQLLTLSDWDQAVVEGRVTRDEAETALAPALAQIEVVAGHIPAWLDDDVARMVERALWTDLAQDIGCCDPLYYHALSEADAVWGVALSPDPAAIAALQIIPAVPSADTPDATTAELAFAWLASRAEGLMADGAASPARRRALLIEANLLEELFGLPADLPLERSLATLAAREGFAAQPVAPLIRMAALTEPGPLRDLLLGHAAARLDSRADHLRPALRIAADSEGEALNRSVVSTTTPMRQMATTTSGFNLSGQAQAPTPLPAPAAPMAVATSSDREAAELVDEALTALLLAGSGAGDISLFVEIANMAERADELLGTGTSLELVDSLASETR